MGSNCCKSSGKDKLNGGVSSGSSVYLKRYNERNVNLLLVEIWSGLNTFVK